MGIIAGGDSVISTAMLNVFEEVRDRTEGWAQYTHLTTLGFQRYATYIGDAVGTFSLFGANREVNVDQAFVTLAVTSELKRERYRSVAEIEQELGYDSARLSAGTDIVSAVSSVEKGFALLGVAGSGKTTALRHLALQAAKGAPIRGRRRVPIFLPVGQARSPKLRSAIAYILREAGIPHPRLLLAALEKHGALLLLVDGLDETTSEARNTLVRDLQSMRRSSPESVICVSGRPLSLSMDITGFAKWEVLPLSQSERHTLIEKWFEPVNPEKGKRLQAICDADPKLLQLGDRPLLLSILCALYHNELEIPSAQEELYERTVSGLLGQWDAFRTIARSSPLSAFSLRERTAVVSWLAYALFAIGTTVFNASRVRASFGYDGVIRHIRRGLPEAEILLESLYNDFGILVEQAPGAYSFTHLAIQEFLTAKHIVDFREEHNLIPRLGDPAWLDIFYYVGRLLPDSSTLLPRLHNSAIKVAGGGGWDALERFWAAAPHYNPAIDRTLVAPLWRRVDAVLAELGVESCELDRLGGSTTLLLKREPPHADGTDSEHLLLAEILRMLKILAYSDVHPSRLGAGPMSRLSAWLGAQRPTPNRLMLLPADGGGYGG